MTMTKICGKCGIEKDFSQYQKQKNGKYGLYSICKDCVKERRKIYRDSHKEHEKERRKEYYLKHREEELSRGREYKLAHREELLLQRKEHHKKHRDKELLQRKEYDSNVRDKALDLYGHKCELCGDIDHLEFHHLNFDGVEERKVYSVMNLYRSLADGNKRSDLQLLCRSCHHKIHNDLRSSI